MPKLDNDRFIEGQNAYARGIGFRAIFEQVEDLDDADWKSTSLLLGYFDGIVASIRRIDNAAHVSEGAGRMTEKKNRRSKRRLRNVERRPATACALRRRAAPIQFAFSTGGLMSKKSPKASSSRKKPRTFAQAFAAVERRSRPRAHHGSAALGWITVGVWSPMQRTRSCARKLGCEA